MRPAISLLTAAAVWVHLLLGCCSHHAHGADGNSFTFHHAEPLAAEGHGHSHDHEHSGPESEEPQCPDNHHEDCHESHCTFLLAGKTTVAADSMVAPLPAAADLAIPQTASSASTWLRDTGDHLRLPVRLHLFYQVLLI